MTPDPGHSPGPEIWPAHQRLDDSTKPEALRAYSQVFGVEIQGTPGRVEKAQELDKHWLKGRF